MSTASSKPTTESMVRRLLLWTLGLVLVASVAGCGGGTGSSSALPVLDDLEPVANATIRADSGRFEMQFEMEIPGLGSPFAFGATGAFDTPGQKAELTMDLGSFARSLGGLAEGFGGTAPPELADASKWKVDMVLDGTVAYMRMPFLSGELPAGKEWVRVDLADAAGLQGFDLGELQSLANGSDPREALDYLRSISGDVTRMGTEDVRGVPCAHYFAVVDWAKALARVERDAGQPGLFDQLRSFGGAISNIPMDVWVDEDNLLRRMQMQFSFSAPGQQGQASASMNAEFFDYGASVEIDAPPAGDVVDARSLKS